MNPDGDAVGSSLGLYQYLKNCKYEQVRVILPNKHPEFLHWIPNNARLLTANRKESGAKKIINCADVIFCLDFNDLDRTDQLATHIRKSSAKKILIDHHPDPKQEFDVIISDVNASSTSEMIYNFIISNNHKQLIDLQIAECLYAGIITDTGSFSYACNNPETYLIVAHLMELGVNAEKIHRLIYDTYSEDRMRLLGYCLSDKLVVLPQHKTAYIYLSVSDLERFNYKDGDTEGVVNYALSIKGVELAVIFIEKKEIVKLSLRSKGEVNVNVLARNFFNGGGHQNAAGGNHKDTLENTLSFFNKILDDISADCFKILQEMQDNS